jgi:hypothetical protein
MKSRYTSIIVILWGGMLVLALGACKPKSVFLENVRIQLDTANIELRNVQFYNDKNIVLRRKASQSDVSESGGKMIEVDGEQVQEILIKRGTPGVVTGNQNGKLLVRFEKGDGKVLRFYKNTKGAYQIDSDRWVARKGLIQYAGLDFVIEVESNDVLLMFKETKKFRSSTEFKTVKGLKVKP